MIRTCYDYGHDVGSYHLFPYHAHAIILAAKANLGYIPTFGLRFNPNCWYY